MIWSLSSTAPAPKKRERLPILAGLWIAASASALLWAVFFAVLRLF